MRIQREQRGLSLAQLSDRLADLGNRFDTSQLGRMETGKRRVMLADAAAIAAALDVPLSLLVEPRTQQVRDLTTQYMRASERERLASQLLGLLREDVHGAEQAISNAGAMNAQLGPFALSNTDLDKVTAQVTIDNHKARVERREKKGPGDAEH
jgi:transcriptional regulator with XRE-family HTH domain